jgi:hypothetical protein
MKLTKSRLQKIINNNNKQTRKIFKKNIKVLHHNSSFKNKKQFNLRNKTLKNLVIF